MYDRYGHMSASERKRSASEQNMDILSHWKSMPVILPPANFSVFFTLMHSCHISCQSWCNCYLVLFPDRNHIGNQLGNPNRNQKFKKWLFLYIFKNLCLILMLMEIKCVQVVICDSIDLIEISRDFKEILDENNM